MECPSCVPAPTGAHFWVFTATLWIWGYLICVLPLSPRETALLFKLGVKKEGLFFGGEGVVCFSVYIYVNNT